ncbi:two-component sensor histidine kinase [Winogradskyella sp. PC-19]|uniref:sensor histidine kinase n=1 Tax=unclassified Winogradskyella TaxID=2615021 RepID=UPI000B3C935D|nr:MULTISPECIES: HAMP domain-containing sensor histidine kinase [unclassified Winogradskyella]ARV09999.1 two-component sensor histidine kinase [Winogradskyella sp. PC-19]RZN83597.1 MAG: HAMP domain-containing histidine kinase [Winogradskyella sp.]
MRINLNRNVIRWIIIISSFIIVSLILWNTYVFFQHFKSEERSKMKSWTIAYSEYATELASSEEDININKVVDYIVLETNITAPMILADDENNIILHRNIFAKPRLSEKNELAQIYNDSIDDNYVEKYKNRLIAKFKNENQPLIMDDLKQTLYYGTSPLLNNLKYYPLALLLIILLFSAVVYFFYRSSKVAEQNKLWTGMAKETAHQIGTPLSSLIGWTEILKSENINPDYIVEIEKDVDRLQTITERFSKIGSVPELKTADIALETKNAITYLQSRTSKLIEFDIEIPEREIQVELNEQLFGWTIENLVKNAIDAMKGKGKLSLQLTQRERLVFINISDTGKGIPKSQFNTIFNPGFTTKKRGWGLGLSLSRRIIEDYHNGKVKVLTSELNKGTTMQIVLKTVS